MKMTPTIERINGGATHRNRWLAMIPRMSTPQDNPDDPNSLLVPVYTLATATRTKIGARFWIARNRHTKEAVA